MDRPVPPATPPRRLREPIMRAMLTTGLILLAMAHPAVRADATLNYRLTQQEGEPAALRIALARFFARIESSAAPDGWWLFRRASSSRCTGSTTSAKPGPC
jgi:hypothetical protein